MFLLNICNLRTSVGTDYGGALKYLVPTKGEGGPRLETTGPKIECVYAVVWVVAFGLDETTV